MAAKRRPRASLYVRLSRAADETNLSLDGMERDLRALAERLGADVAAVHVDDGISGAVRNRPAFRAWLDDAREHRADVLAAWSVDRMTREGLPVAAEILDVLETTGVRLIDTQGIDSAGERSAFRLVFVIKAELARAELESMRTRARARAERAAVTGQWSAGAAPYGYRIVRVDGRPTLAIEPAEASAIVAAAQRVTAGEPLARIVREWNRDGVPPRRAKTWTSTSLLRVLTGPTVRGHATRHGAVLRDTDGTARELWPPILSPGLAEQVRAALVPQPGRGRRPGARADARLLSGLLRCATCGRTLRASSSQGVARYACPAPEQACTARATINAAKVEQWAETELLDDLTRGAMFTERVPATDAATVESARLDEAITGALAELATAATAETFTRLQALQARRAELDARPVSSKWITRRTGRTVGEEFERRDVPARRDMLGESINLDHVVVSAAKWPQQPVAERVTPIWHEDDAEELA